ncbi:unnamed protein product [Arctia plantaginis]|uniref:Uncharacterized protein n=1 Tax=Arctia plantaginis TaxID=874455 RepID=A0A8S0ZK06_ARCPL|nr:unnamed protein product [Arctia plantaginis]
MSNEATVTTQQSVDEPDLNNIHYPKYPRYRASSALIIPDVVQSLAHFIRSFLPTINKGIDSRVGFGFAFGNHADFQVVLELGPQKKTKALDGRGFQTTSTNAKRQASLKPKITKVRKKFFKSDGDKYLQNWAQMMRDQKFSTKNGK